MSKGISALWYHDLGNALVSAIRTVNTRQHLPSQTPLSTIDVVLLCSSDILFAPLLCSSPPLLIIVNFLLENRLCKWVAEQRKERILTFSFKIFLCLRSQKSIDDLNRTVYHITPWCHLFAQAQEDCMHICLWSYAHAGLYDHRDGSIIADEGMLYIQYILH